MARRVLVTGGVRSGKSARAESWLAGDGDVVYLATLRADEADEELAGRIARHRARRPDDWRTVQVVGEAPPLPDALRAAGDEAAVLFDGLGAWLADRFDDLDAALDELDAFWRAAGHRRGGPVLVVAEEAGLGLLPSDGASRRWLDALGDARQRLAAEADEVELVVAGRVVPLPAGESASSSPAGEAAPLSPAGEAAPLSSAGEARPPTSGAAAEPWGGPHGAARPDPLRVHGDTAAGAAELDLAVNVHWSGPPEGLRTALVQALEGVDRYPDPASAAATMAARFGRDPSEVLITAGAVDALWLLAFAGGVRRACVVHPQFTEPEAALRTAGVPVHRLSRDPAAEWRLDPAGVPDDADLVVLGNPNNPTGTLDPPDVIASLCRPGRLTVVDEAFMDFVDEPGAGLAHVRDLPGLVVLRTVTKLWSIPGIRAGCLLGPSDLVTRLAAAHRPWPTGTLAHVALAWCAGDEAYRRTVAAEVATARDELQRGLTGIAGVVSWPSAANFVLLRVPHGEAVADALAARGIAVRRSTFPGLSRDHLRVAVRAPGTNRGFLDALSRAVVEAGA
ncbi:bifunctional adenosylcobinamide kinase/adenosylcobinamide-phosphate guanylyltransferase [Egibacter rhizosphaerae]|uniref:bifunctional adenosylcobinamide kinase/adenosylcobinamide-phosphate guanylyltransferase n=1 Tax=Egibacter rhizosphaerae TaxID=1670831 RepID=UPI0013F1763D|nr:bifunctional adenosylcobinamide kinase/adenosylcobinamide-phosphate guanylyltransferase [Egibacter rhizosphaerae]